MNRVIETYRGFKIVEKGDFGSGHLINGEMVKHGYNVLDEDALCNIMPGATWAQTIDRAKSLVDAYIAAGGHSKIDWAEWSHKCDSDKFWQIVRQQQRTREHFAAIAKNIGAGI